MTPLRSLALALVLAALAAPVSAQTPFGLGDLGGDWQGSGTFARGAEEPGRIRCKIEFSTTARGTTLVAGRCASSEGSDVFGLEVTEGEGGAISAMNRSEPPGSLPAELTGVLGADGMRLQGEGIAALELRRDGQELTLAIVSGVADRPGRMDVRLARIAP